MEWGRIRFVTIASISVYIFKEHLTLHKHHFILCHSSNDKNILNFLLRLLCMQHNHRRLRTTLMINIFVLFYFHSFMSLRSMIHSATPAVALNDSHKHRFRCVFVFWTNREKETQLCIILHMTVLVNILFSVSISMWLCCLFHSIHIYTCVDVLQLWDVHRNRRF